MNFFDPRLHTQANNGAHATGLTRFPPSLTQAALLHPTSSDTIGHFAECSRVDRMLSELLHPLNSPDADVIPMRSERLSAQRDRLFAFHLAEAQKLDSPNADMHVPQALRYARPGSRDAFLVLIGAAQRPGPLQLYYAEQAIAAAARHSPDAFCGHLQAAVLPSPRRIYHAHHAIHLAQPGSRNEFWARLNAARIPNAPNRLQNMQRAMKLSRANTHERYYALVAAVELCGSQRPDYVNELAMLRQASTTIRREPLLYPIDTPRSSDAESEQSLAVRSAPPGSQPEFEACLVAGTEPSPMQSEYRLRALAYAVLHREHLARIPREWI